MGTTNQSDADNHKKFVASIAMLGAAYGREVDELTYAAYWTALHDVEASHVERAVARQIRSTDQWMPRPGELRHAALSYRPHPELITDQWAREDAGVPNDTPEALRAWQTILREKFPAIKADNGPTT